MSAIRDAFVVLGRLVNRRQRTGRPERTTRPSDGPRSWGTWLGATIWGLGLLVALGTRLLAFVIGRDSPAIAEPDTGIPPLLDGLLRGLAIWLAVPPATTLLGVLLGHGLTGFQRRDRERFLSGELRELAGLGFPVGVGLAGALWSFLLVWNLGQWEQFLGLFLSLFGAGAIRILASAPGETT